MPELTKRWKWIGIAVAAGIAVVAGTTFLVDRVFFGPSPEQARAALVEHRLCSPDARIIEKRFGRVDIAGWECNLWRRSVRNGKQHGKFGYTSVDAKWVVTEGFFFAHGPMQ